MERANGVVESVSRNLKHTFSKYTENEILLVAGLGVEGDAHFGKTVKHRSRVRVDPEQPNLRQVHIIHSELFRELKSKGHRVLPGEMGENITTTGIDLLGLPTGCRLMIGKDAVVEITGLRNPCSQLDDLQDGLMRAVLEKDQDGNVIRKAGVMGVVISGGYVRTGDGIEVRFPEGPFVPLAPV